MGHVKESMTLSGSPPHSRIVISVYPRSFRFDYSEIFFVTRRKIFGRKEVNDWNQLLENEDKMKAKTIKETNYEQKKH